MALLEEADQVDNFLLVVGTDYIQHLKMNQEGLVGCTRMMRVEDTYYQEVVLLRCIHYVAACWEDSSLVVRTIKIASNVNISQYEK